jgi:Arc/MetJ-type ribon-helix-helix transcriptional regulator
MPTTVEIKGELENKLEKLLLAGFYKNKSEAVRDAIRHLLKEYDAKDLAVSLYRQGKVSIAKAAEIAGVSFPKMKEILVEARVSPRLGVESAEDLKRDYKRLKRSVG